MKLDIKICGLKTEEAVDKAVSLGASHIGFIFFPKSPRNIEPSDAGRLADRVRGRVKIVAVTVNADNDTLDEIVDQLSPDILQLHGSETPERVLNVKAVYGLPVMKALSVRDADDLKKEARLELDRLVAVHAGRVGKRVKSLTLRDTRSRWGSCSADGALSFSWRIAMAPPRVIDYLAAHEVAHLREMNHSPAFWTLCEQLCPGMEDAKRWLKRNGSLLHAVDFG